MTLRIISIYYPFAPYILKIKFISKHLRINRAIRVPTIRLIGEDEEQLGIKSIEEALKIAEEAGTDLVEVAPKANPPVCKVMDYGKHLYRQSKIDRKHKKMQKQGEMKGIRISLRIDQHDLKTKINNARKFLEARNSVKVSLIFKGREAAHSEIGKEKLDLFYDSLKDIAHLDQPPKKSGYSMIMILAPLNK